MRRAARVLRAAEYAQRAAHWSSGCHLDHMVGHQVGRGVRRVLAEARAPVAHGGAVVGDQLAAALALGRVV
jgi:hypothetical protein